ncbi:GFA family protein [Paracoccus sp. (in: a-proteobacteria)]|uniref:GFA family protein n=1 Tax=Paracoccus sp. TaxID=267 RepID=UPI0028A18F09|nr:GFA family protein [Paracoccus sp. (in: a-proteobacteria)]
MIGSYSGGCACGAIRYTTRDRPIYQNHCQCLDCQKRSGTGHASFLTFPKRSSVTITGSASSWRVAGDSGNGKFHFFCPTCGSPVFVMFEGMAELIAVHASTLDAAAHFLPEAVTYSSSGLSWDYIDPVLARFEKMPVL